MSDEFRGRCLIIHLMRRLHHGLIEPLTGYEDRSTRLVAEDNRRLLTAVMVGSAYRQAKPRGNKAEIGNLTRASLLTGLAPQPGIVSWHNSNMPYMKKRSDFKEARRSYSEEQSVSKERRLSLCSRVLFLLANGP